MPIAYIDINSVGTIGAALRDQTAPNKVHGALHVQNLNANNLATWNPLNHSTGLPGLSGAKLTEISDGLSKTILLGEDVGRSETFYTAKYTDPIGIDLLPVIGGTPNPYRNAWRWADPDTANGVSGPPSTAQHDTSGSASGGFGGVGGGLTNGTLYGDSFTVINNSRVPFGGPSYCPWTANNCGPNDELFSFHGSGANVVMGDGHVAFLNDAIDPIVLRRLATPAEGLPIQDINGVNFTDY
jgi:prepilin-type processing-associated H-X9-DG protein